MLWTFASMKWWLLSVVRLCHCGEVPSARGGWSVVSVGLATPRTWLQVRTYSAVTSTPSGPGKLRWQHTYTSSGCRMSTAAFHSHSFLGWNYSQLYINSHSWSLPITQPRLFFFFYIHIFKKNILKNPYFAGMLSIFHISHDHCIYRSVFFKFWKAWYLLTCLAIVEKKKG